jgi:single-strand DNA-binding protein
MPGFTMNTVCLSGNLTADPELRHLPSGTALCKLRVAVNERVKDGTGEWSDRAMYFDVTVWSGIGEWVAGNLSKGDGIAVQGRLQWREWEKDGVKRQAVDIVAESIVPVPRGERQTSGGRQPAAAVQPVRGYGSAGRPGQGVGDDDIPF